MKVLGRVRSAARGAGFAAWTAGFVSSYRLAERFDEEFSTPRGKQIFTDAWIRGIIPLLGVDLEVVSGEAPRTLGENYLIVSNHRAPLDILVAVHLVGGVVLSHEGVAKIPFLGDAARAANTIFVDRDNQRSGAQAIRKMRRFLKAGQNVIVFPEGTTYPGDEVRPFKRGSFSAARGLENVKVLPLGVAYEPGAEFFRESFGAYASRMSARPRTPVWVTIGEPVPVPQRAEGQEGLRERVQVLATRAARARDRSPAQS